MKNFVEYITESDDVLDKVIQQFISVLLSRFKTGKLSSSPILNTKKRILMYLMNTDGLFNEFIDPSSYDGISGSYAGNRMLKKFIREHPNFSNKNIDLLDETELNEYVNLCKPIFFREYFSDIDKDLKEVDNKITVDFSMTLVGNVIKIESDLERLANQLDFYASLGIYWSFYKGNAYSSLDEVKSEPVYVTLKALANLDAISLENTRQALLKASEEAEITLKSDSVVELYEIVFKLNGKIKKYKLKQQILAKI